MMTIKSKDMKKLADFRAMYKKKLGKFILDAEDTDMQNNRELFEVLQLLLLVEERLAEFVDADLAQAKVSKAIDKKAKEMTDGKESAVVVNQNL